MYCSKFNAEIPELVIVIVKSDSDRSEAELRNSATSFQLPATGSQLFLIKESFAQQSNQQVLTTITSH